MSTGIRNKLTGQIGEHLVSAILGTMGYYASPYSGNVPGFETMATGLMKSTVGNTGGADN